MDSKKRLIVFCFWFIFSLIFWRVLVSLKNGNVSVLRAITGLNFHHYHYGIFFILIGCLILIFYNVNGFSVGVVSFGLGTILDGSISRLMEGGVRSQEIYFYNQNLLPTVLLFGVVILLSVIFCVFSDRKRF